MIAHQRTASRGSLGLVPPLPGSRGLLWLGKRGVLGAAWEQKWQECQASWALTCASKLTQSTLPSTADVGPTCCDISGASALQVEAEV